MSRPLLVIHGVSNHTPDRFDAEVSSLQRVLGGKWRTIKVFWGDLGAKAGVDYSPVIPSAGGPAVRGGDGDAGLAPDLVAAVLPVTAGTEVRSASVRAELMVTAATGAGVRGGARADVDAAIAEAIRSEVPQTSYLSRIDNAVVLSTVGRSVGEATRRGMATEAAAGGGPAPGRPGTSGAKFGWSVTSGRPGAGAETRGVRQDAGRIARGLLHDADQIVGAVLGQVLGSLNQAMRRGFVSDAIGFIGDIFVYEHLRPLVQERIWQAIEADPELGRGGWGRDPDHRVHLAGHSLGGVIAFHAATAADSGRKLYLDGLVTFGSQAPMFHLMDPARSGIRAYAPGRPVPVGDGIKQWTNLWEPMDPLAFIAARVFRLGTAERPVSPRDIAVAHLASYGLWTHSAYWHAPELPSAIASTMA